MNSLKDSERVYRRAARLSNLTSGMKRSTKINEQMDRSLIIESLIIELNQSSKQNLFYTASVMTTATTMCTTQGKQINPVSSNSPYYCLLFLN